MTGGAQVVQIASALVRRGTDVLMALQKRPEDRGAHWALAGWLNRASWRRKLWYGRCGKGPETSP